MKTKKSAAKTTTKKYEFTGETKEVEGHTLRRIRALRTITDPNVYGWEISSGRTGGWIEKKIFLTKVRPG